MSLRQRGPYLGIRSYLYIFTFAGLLSMFITYADSREADFEKDTKEFVHRCESKFVMQKDPFYAWSRMLGWGQGSINRRFRIDTVFTWFAYTNSDGLIQFDINTNMPEKYLEQIKQTRQKGNNWKAFIVGKYTWVGTDNFIIKDKCRQPEGCSNYVVLNDALDFFESKIGGIKLAVNKYYDGL